METQQQDHIAEAAWELIAPHFPGVDFETVCDFFGVVPEEKHAHIFVPDNLTVH